MTGLKPAIDPALFSSLYFIIIWGGNLQKEVSNLTMEPLLKCLFSLALLGK